MDDQSAIRVFLQVLGATLLATGGQPVLNTAITERSAKDALLKAFPAVVVCAVGILTLLAGFFWHPKPTPENRLIATLETVATDSKTYLVMILIVWVYMVTGSILKDIHRNNELTAIRNDVQSISNVLDRFVLPRHLTDVQINAVAGFLQNFTPQEVVFYVVKDDPEASTYQGAIQRALQKGGWHTRDVTYAKDSHQQSGLSITFVRKEEHMRGGYVDPDRLDASLVLTAAFGIAGIRIDGGRGTSNGGNIDHDYMEITVGRRHRDPYALPVAPTPW